MGSMLPYIAAPWILWVFIPSITSITSILQKRKKAESFFDVTSRGYVLIVRMGGTIARLV